MKKKVTFSDIAKYTNFSKTTISRYFNNPESLTEETKNKIKNALTVVDYKQNKVAKCLANGKTEIIGVIVPNLFLDYYSKILNDMIGTLHLNANDYTPNKYAEIVRVSLSARKLEKSKQYSKQDLELLALFSSLDAEVKDNLKALIKSIIAKGGKMWDLHKTKEPNC